MSNLATISVQTAQTVDTRYTQDIVPLLDTSKFEHMQRIAMMMARCAYVPKDLTKGDDIEARVANCFLVVNQAVRWGMDPFALAQTAYFVSGKMGFEGKTIAAAINSDPRLKGRLDYTFEGEGDKLTITVSGTFRDTGDTKTIKGSVAQWKTNHGLWGKDNEQQLVYRGTRQWARRWMPDRLLGIYSADELDDIASRDVPTGHRAQRMKDVTPSSPALEIPDIPDAPTQAEASQEVEETISKTEAEAFLAKLAEDIELCTSATELAEISEHNADMIARLPKAQKAKAAKMLSEAADEVLRSG